MLSRLVAAIASLPLGLTAQGVRLCDRIEAPMVYVAMDAGAVPATAGNPLTQLLATPSLAGLFGDSAAAAFGFVRGVLGRASGEIELALLGVLPAGLYGGDRGGLPLVVVRTRLSSADAARMRDVLAEPKIARPLRIVRGHQTHALVTDAGGGSAAAPVLPGPGLQIEAVVVGDDLIVANNSRGIDEALDDRTTSGPRGLGADERYVRLIERLRPARGTLVAFADWRRFGPRLVSIGGVSGALLEWSGLDGVDAIAAAVSPYGADGAAAGLQSTVLLSFPAGSVATPHPASGGSSATGHAAIGHAINGWLGMVEPAAARQLVDDLPVGGLGGFVFAVDPGRVVEAASQVGGFCARVSGACGERGIDLGRIVRRLGHRGALQLLLLSGPAAVVTPAFALQAQGRKAAVDIVEEIARAFGESPRGSDRSPPHVDLRDVGGLERLRLGVVDDLLVFAQEADAVAALAAARRERARARSQLDAAVTAALRAFGADKGDRFAGLVHIDASAWLAAVGAAAVVRSGAPAPDLPTHHTGLLDLDTVEAARSDAGNGGSRTLVRLQLLSTR